MAATRTERDLVREDAAALDTQDPLRHMRREFFIPSKSDLRTWSLPKLGQRGPSLAAEEPEPEQDADREEESTRSSSIYLCGNSLGLQPRLASTRIQQYLTT